jgi:hypothetical protein
MGTLDSLVVHRTLYCSLSGECHVSRPLGFGAVHRWSLLSSCSTGQTGVTSRRRLSSDFWYYRLCTINTVDRWAKLIVAPLSHRTVWWLTRQFDEFLRMSGEKTRERPVRGGLQPRHWTLSGAHRHRLRQFCLFQPCRIPQVIFFVCLCELYAPEIKHPLGKLVSAYGVWWTSNIKTDYRKCWDISLSISPFLVIDANTDQSKYKV